MSANLPRLYTSAHKHQFTHYLSYPPRPPLTPPLTRLIRLRQVVHSPSFYTSPFGYKLCLRANLYVRDGECYLALFIHMRRGENDDILEWPFSGRFIVSLVRKGDGENGGFGKSDACLSRVVAIYDACAGYPGLFLMEEKTL